jgi:formylglycine-generating enzyme required for sulfatase activity
MFGRIASIAIPFIMIAGCSGTPSPTADTKVGSDNAAADAAAEVLNAPDGVTVELVSTDIVQKDSLAPDAVTSDTAGDQICVPLCDGKLCGDNGCGGLCGECEAGEVCTPEGSCEVPSCSGLCNDEGPDMDGNGDPDCACDEDCFDSGNCCGDICDACPDLAGCCVPQCEDKECGEDGCGGSCGACALDEECNGQGQCVNPYGLVWKPIPGGTFTMGCSPGDGDCGNAEKPAHSVTLSAFEMLETEVTEGQYEAVTGEDPSCDFNGGGGANSPVECVNWNEAKAFCEAVGGRLCTEAEWEYAARGGTTTKYYCGDNASCLGGIAWYDDNSGSHKHNVKGKSPNGYGLYDMLGNVFEWTADWYSSSYYSVSPANNPNGPNGGSVRVNRGGCLGCYGGTLRVSNRTGVDPSYSYADQGGRCCRSVEP